MALRSRTDAPARSSSTPSSRGSTRSRWSCRRRQSRRRGSGRRRGRSSSPIAIVPRRLAARRLERLEARVRAAAAGGRVPGAVGQPGRRSWEAVAHDALDAASAATRSRVVVGAVIGALVARNRDAAGRGRLDDHRPADDAVDRLVPARDPALPARARARSSSSSCSARRRRSPTVSSTASTTSRRCCCGPAGCSARSGWPSFRYVILPAALPSFVGGLKQGWAFAWRSLLAGELLVVIPGQYVARPAARGQPHLRRLPGVIAVMIVILVIGVLVDSLVFGKAERWIRRRYGLVDESIGLARSRGGGAPRARASRNAGWSGTTTLSTRLRPNTVVAHRRRRRREPRQPVEPPCHPRQDRDRRGDRHDRHRPQRQRHRRRAGSCACPSRAAAVMCSPSTLRR